MIRGVEAAHGLIPANHPRKGDIMKSKRTNAYIRSAIATVIGILTIKTVNAVELEPKLDDTCAAQYVVVRGDTLWTISAKLFQEPRRWQEIWHWNRSLIEDPDRIYPGQAIALKADAPVAPAQCGAETSHAESRGQVISGTTVPVGCRQTFQYMEEGRLPRVPLNCDSPQFELGMVFRK
jgi:hypothetical protein